MGIEARKSLIMNGTESTDVYILLSAVSPSVGPSWGLGLTHM